MKRKKTMELPSVGKTFMITVKDLHCFVSAYCDLQKMGRKKDSAQDTAQERG